MIEKGKRKTHSYRVEGGVAYIAISPALSSRWGQRSYDRCPMARRGKIGAFSKVIKRNKKNKRKRGEKTEANWSFIIYDPVIHCLREERRKEVVIRKIFV